MALRVGRLLLCAALVSLSIIRFANADNGTLIYRARVVHNDRAAMAVVSGTIDLSNGSFHEQIDNGYRMDWKQIPARVLPARPELPAIWRMGGSTVQRFGAGLPRYDSPLLRHFIVGDVIGGVDELKEQHSYLGGQLSVDKVTRRDDGSFEIIGRLRGSALVIVGSRVQQDGRWLPRDIAVLGSSGELYQYQFDETAYSPGPPLAAISLPPFNAADYVQFGGQPQAVPIRPVKEWLVFQAQLPSGRPLNLIFDSGADTMIVDDMVLRLDANLEPSGEASVDSGVGSERMQLYDGFAFNVGGVEFKNLPVLGTQLTFAGLGADVRIHGIVGNEILQLCQLDIDLQGGTLKLLRPDAPEPTQGEKLDLTFIQQLPHIEAEVQETGKSLFLLDTGQRQPLTVNLDHLSGHKLDDELVMDGFMGDIGGSLTPRYMMEEVSVSLAGQTYNEKTVDATPVSSFNYEGVPVVGAIGFSMLARHFGGITFDYRRRALYLRDPGSYNGFLGRPEAWGASGLARANLGGETEKGPQAKNESLKGIPFASALQQPTTSEAEPAADDQPATSAPPAEEQPAVAVPLEETQAVVTPPVLEDSSLDHVPGMEPGADLDGNGIRRGSRAGFKQAAMLVQIEGFVEQLVKALSLRSYGINEDAERARQAQAQNGG